MAFVVIPFGQGHALGRCQGKLRSESGNLKKSANLLDYKDGEIFELGGGFKYFLFSPLFGEMIYFD